MTKDQQYINEVLAISLNQKNDTQDSYRPTWHFSPNFGLLNDPNGLAYFNGQYHLFYQWNPKACKHGAKAWGLATSEDMIHWQHEPLALAPTEEYETHGCYSGSGLVVGDKLELFYTGNVKYKDGSRTAYQCRAIKTKNRQVEKKGIVLALPEGYSGHVRDPKVWQHSNEFFMVLGAEDLTYKGKVLLYSSTDLDKWEFVGELFGDGISGTKSDDFMLECPDFFQLGELHVLITCPKSWEELNGKKCETFNVDYHLGEFDYTSKCFRPTITKLMDHGFEFYAPQTFADKNGRRILIGWMGKPDENEFFQPTIEHGWIHQMSSPRELTIENGVLLQKPCSELKILRKQEQEINAKSAQLEGLSAELVIENINYDLTIVVANDLKVAVTQEGFITLRFNLRTQSWEDKLWQGDVNHLQLLRDHSSIEVFINHGQAVSSSRFFGKNTDGNIGFELYASKEIRAMHWHLAN